MKSFEEIKNENKSSTSLPMSLEDELFVEQVMELKLSEFVELPKNIDESEQQFADLSEIMNQYGETKLKDLDEGIFGKIMGGIAGFVVGPSIGKVVANALGIEKGIIYDLLVSRLVGAALGAAITKYIGGK